MPMFEYLCRTCHYRHLSDMRGDSLGSCRCGNGELRRVFSFSFKPIVHTHFNPTIGKVVSDDAQVRSELSRLSDEATARTGILHDYQPVDLRGSSLADLGGTEEGLNRTSESLMHSTVDDKKYFGE